MRFDPDMKNAWGCPNYYSSKNKGNSGLPSKLVMLVDPSDPTVVTGEAEEAGGVMLADTPATSVPTVAFSPSKSPPGNDGNGRDGSSSSKKATSQEVAEVTVGDGCF